MGDEGCLQESEFQISMEARDIMADCRVCMFEIAHDIEIILFIARKGKCRKIDLYDIIGRNANMPKRLDAMEECGLIVQTLDDKTTWISITESGREIAEGFMKIDEIIAENARRKSSI